MPASSNVFRCARLRAIVKAFSPARVTPPCVGRPSLSLSLSLPIPPPHYGARVPWRSAADPQHAVRAAASSACALALKENGTVAGAVGSSRLRGRGTQRTV